MRLYPTKNGSSRNNSAIRATVGVLLSKMKPTASLVRKLGAAVKKAAGKGGSSWYTPHMAAATRAISERIPLVDLVVEVRDARVPLSSGYELLRNFMHSSRHVIVLNKMDLASRSQTKEWKAFFEQENYLTYGVNSHNKENIKEFLNFIQAQVRELRKTDHASHTITVMLVGIPNVGKSALANSLHHIGRISAAEKGKLKHATVSPLPCETKNISSMKIASHPNIYVLDTPGVLPPEIPDDEVCAKLALTGAISDCLVGETELAQYFLAILNLSDEHKKWAKLPGENEKLSPDGKGTTLAISEVEKRRQYATDHTQDFIVREVRWSLFEAISSFQGSIESEKDLSDLIETEFRALWKAFQVTDEPCQEAFSKVAAKLLNLYRTGRLGHYTLDPILKISS
ncbi:hypothetical protein NMG60_11029295 [Bertholletia excelsa]